VSGEDIISVALIKNPGVLLYACVDGLPYVEEEEDFDESEFYIHQAGLEDEELRWACLLIQAVQRRHALLETETQALLGALAETPIAEALDDFLKCTPISAIASWGRSVFNIAKDFFDVSDWAQRYDSRKFTVKSDLVAEVIGELEDRDTRAPNYSSDKVVKQRVYRTKMRVRNTAGNGVVTYDTSLEKFGLGRLGQGETFVPVFGTHLDESRDFVLTDNLLLNISSH